MPSIHKHTVIALLVHITVPSKLPPRSEIHCTNLGYARRAYCVYRATEKAERSEAQRVEVSCSSHTSDIPLDLSALPTRSLALRHMCIMSVIPREHIQVIFQYSSGYN